ncbi:hypothetical protein THIOM_004503 [Candidatus Thiomargarita nelsonii]|uniref:Uncharacterized protein n=1 Tax=Candidatus Thiomargarita nelsonii TaxID=1003181 RepID=A0A176RVV3_9GAMM|nr:hypothetical protein THIOM_004503 [Candidatus Thiomargarita nelsonii]
MNAMQHHGFQIVHPTMLGRTFVGIEKLRDASSIVAIRAVGLLTLAGSHDGEPVFSLQSITSGSKGETVFKHSILPLL